MPSRIRTDNHQGVSDSPSDIFRVPTAWVNTFVECVSPFPSVPPPVDDDFLALVPPVIQRGFRQLPTLRMVLVVRCNGFSVAISTSEPFPHCRYTVKDETSARGRSSTLKIRTADRSDSATFSCTAANPYGKDTGSSRVIIQGIHRTCRQIKFPPFLLLCFFHLEPPPPRDEFARLASLKFPNKGPQR